MRGAKPGANVATETVVAALSGEGYATGIDTEALKIAGAFAARHIIS
jgi:hypothetical protein